MNIKNILKKHLAKIIIIGTLTIVVLIYIGPIFKFVVGVLALLAFGHIAIKLVRREIDKRKQA